MQKSHPTMQKLAVSSGVVMSLAFTPLLTGGAFAHVNSNEVHHSHSSGTDHISGSKGDKTASPIKTSTLIDRGDRGQDVKSMQTKLQDRGYYTYHLDGIFGPITEDAVRDFQSEHNLAVDGIVGPNTSAALSGNPGKTANAADAKADSSDQTASQIVATAKKLIGSPYKWGGTTPDGFDSSGFINYVFKQEGIQLSRTENAMWENDGVKVDSPGVGDVVFFQGTYDTEGASHSGIYIGNHKMIHAGGDGVQESDLQIDYWQNHYLGAKSFK